MQKNNDFQQQKVSKIGLNTQFKFNDNSTGRVPGSGEPGVKQHL